jgi:hypothetical protein
MKLLDYIRGLRKGKEAHRLEKESMKDPFLADAMDGYGQVEGNHEQRIGQLRMQVSARATKKRNLSKKQNSYAVTWSIAACLVIGIGISCYFLFLKKRMTDDVFIAKEEIPSAVFEPISPKEEISSLAETKIKQDSTHEVTATPTDKKDIVAKSKSIPKTQSAPVAITPVIEETVGRTDIQEERIVADTDTSLSEVHQLKAAKAATPNLNLIKGKVTDEKGEPIIGASVAYTGTNIGTVTDLNGEFILKKEKGNKQLTAQFIGYEPVEIPVDTSRTMLMRLRWKNAWWLATLSLSRKLLTNNLREDFTKSNRLAPHIEPDTSIRNTRLEAGKLSVGISFAFSPIRTRRLAGFQGQAPASIVIFTGSFPVGFG